MREQLAQQSVTVICRRHTWVKTKTPGVLICAKCEARAREQSPPQAPQSRNASAYTIGRDVRKPHNPYAATTQGDYDETENEGYTNPNHTRKSIIVRQPSYTRVEPARQTDELPPEQMRSGLHPLIYPDFLSQV